MRSIRLLVLALAVTAIAGCAGTTPGWTYAPAPSATPIPSVEPSASAEPGESAEPSGSAEPSISAAPSSSAGSSPDPGASGEPAPSVAPGGNTVQVAALNLAYDPTELTVTADEPFQVVFANNDQAVPHDFDIHEGDPAGPKVLDSPAFNGVETRTIDAEALPAGIYAFVCSVHPTTMFGTLTAE